MKAWGSPRKFRKHVTHQPDLDGTGLNIGVVVARFNPDLTEKMLKICLNRLRKLKVSEERITALGVHGAFELPNAAARLAQNCEAVIALGVVIRGETSHHTHITTNAAYGLMKVSLTSGKPVVFGVLSTDTHEQAAKRVGQAESYAEIAVEQANYARVSQGYQ